MSLIADTEYKSIFTRQLSRTSVVEIIVTGLTKADLNTLQKELETTDFITNLNVNIFNDTDISDLVVTEITAPRIEIKQGKKSYSMIKIVIQKYYT